MAAAAPATETLADRRMDVRYRTNHRAAGIAALRDAIERHAPWLRVRYAFQGYQPAVEADVSVQRVEVKETRNGNRRFVLRDADGKEYTTFRPPIGEEAARFEGRRAHISFHEDERNGFTNVYLDAIEAVRDSPSGDGGDHDAEVAAWQTAVEAAPWLSGESEPERAVDPEELFDRLKPFQERVAADIRDQTKD